MVEISTSLLSVEKQDVIPIIYKLETAKTDYFHIDVMDGEFVTNKTNEKMHEFCEYIKNISNIPLDVHLMVKDVESYIKSYLIYNPNIITIHYEAVKDKETALKMIKYIKENDCKAGISINPDTNIQEIYELLPYVHLVLVMCVEPGEGGQKLIPQTLKKIKKLSEYIDKNNLEVDIEVDGGINLNNVEDIKNAGANIIVSGNGIISQSNYKDTIKNMKNA